MSINAPYKQMKATGIKKGGTAKKTGSCGHAMGKSAYAKKKGGK